MTRRDRRFKINTHRRPFVILFQTVPTEDWGETEIEMLLSQAYVLSTLFGGSDAHLTRVVPPT
jgi:hypothetical protein